MFLNVDPAGQEHGRSMLPHGGREGEGEDADSEGRARARARATVAGSIRNILKQRKKLTDEFTDPRVLKKDGGCPGPNNLI